MDEMTPLLATEQVRGDLLSCYSTATAGLLRTMGVPDVLALGTQVFLGVRRVGALTEFLHYHTPLVGDGVLYRVELRRCGAADPGTAAQAVSRQARQVGAVVVTGCTTRLSWIETGGEEPAPHWFLAAPTGDPSGEMLVDDRFTWIDDAGEHPGFTGPLPAAQVGALAWSPPPVSPQQSSRERWALGDHRDRPSWSADLPWQWLEVAGTEAMGADTVEFGRTMLGRTVNGQITDARVAAHGWAVGAAAFDALGEWLETGLSDPATYLCNNDFWVAARNRQMAAVSLRHLSRARVSHGPGRLGELGELGDWVDSTLVPAWTGLVRAMRYNSLRVTRGRQPRPGVLTELRSIADLEDRFRTRLRDAL
jgi:hypothetical protein